MSGMCGRAIQARGPVHYNIVDGLNVRDSRLDNYPRRWNGCPSQELLVIRQHPGTGERSLDLLKWGLIPSRSIYEEARDVARALTSIRAIAL